MHKIIFWKFLTQNLIHIANLFITIIVFVWSQYMLTPKSLKIMCVCVASRLKNSLHGRLQLSCAVKSHYFNFRYLFKHWQFRSLWRECQIIRENFHLNKTYYFIWHAFATKEKQSSDATSIENALLNQCLSTRQLSWSS